SAFYAAVAGWQYEPGREGALMIRAETEEIGRIAPMPASAAHAPPHWLGYVAVQDVDAIARQATELGGRSSSREPRFRAWAASRSSPIRMALSLPSTPRAASELLLGGCTEPTGGSSRDGLLQHFVSRLKRTGPRRGRIREFRRSRGRHGACIESEAEFVPEGGPRWRQPPGSPLPTAPIWPLASRSSRAVSPGSRGRSIA